MLQLEDIAAPPQTGWLEHLIDAFPDEAESFDLCGYANGGVCIFLSVLPSLKALPARRQVAAILRHIGEQVLSSRNVFAVEVARFGGEAVRRLAAVLAEVVVDGSSKDFPLLAASREVDGQVEIWVTQGFCDLVLGRWDQWASGKRDDGPRSSFPESESPPREPSERAAFTVATPPPPLAGAAHAARETLSLRLGRLAGAFSPKRPARRLGLAGNLSN
ncbi:MAG TPA: hypothetical protein VGX68_07465 [Thermoanaerobaculia bacterium]|jgi:hypothetical protein|nr:hypothetical protein [Thermoanaerobaculia bacterium]